MIITISTTAELIAALDLLHDRWVDIDRLSADLNSSTVILPFWSEATRRPPRDRDTKELLPFDRQLVVRRVRRCHVVDREGIGVYSLDRLNYMDGVLTITADPHLTVALEVEQLEVRIEETTQPYHDGE